MLKRKLPLIDIHPCPPQGLKGSAQTREIVSVISEMGVLSIGARRYGRSIGRGLTIEKDMWQIYLSVGALAQWSV